MNCPFISAILEQTKDKSKVRPLSGVADTSFGTNNIQDCTKFVNNCWIATDEIEFVEETLEKKRLDKLKEILN